MKIIEIEEATIAFEEVYVHFHFKKGDEPVAKSTVEKVYDYVSVNLKERKYLLVTTEEGTKLTEPAREFASSKKFDEVIKADAIVVNNYSHEIAANFFIRFNRPNRPVKLFPNRDKAVAWIHEMNNKENEG